MSQTRQQISDVIASLNVGDTVQVVWSDSNNRSTESGVVWQPSDSQYLGLGPDLLNPEDTELIGISVTKRAPVEVPQPPLGAVAVWITQGAKEVYAFKRFRKGWYMATERFFGPTPWALIVAAYGSPAAVFEKGVAPSAPTISTATAGNRKIDVVSVLGAAGSSVITDVEYNLVFEFDAGAQETTGWISTKQATGTFTINNLEPGIEFLVRVRAVNSSGPGSASAQVAATPFGIPGTPSAPTADPGNASVELSWSAPLSDGFSPITGYKIERISASGNAGWVSVTEDTGSTDTTYTVTGLTNGTQYGFRVSAINAAGVGLPSASSSGVTPST